MGRVIVFDNATALAVHRETGVSVVVQPDTDASGVIARALASPAGAVAVVPFSVETAAVIRFRRKAASTAEFRPMPVRAGYAPSGFLGLSDEIVLEEEPAPPKKWWQKLWD